MSKKLKVTELGEKIKISEEQVVVEQRLNELDRRFDTMNESESTNA